MADSINYLIVSHTDSASIESFCLSHHGEENRAADFELSERLGLEILNSLGVE